MLRRIFAGVRGLFRQRAIERDLDEELEDFLERSVHEHERRGLPPEAARRAARLDLGNRTAVKEQVQASFWETTLLTVARDARHGCRLLLRAPAAAAVSILTMALGIGATTAMFTLANDIVFKPLPVLDPDDLVLFEWRAGPRATPPVSIAGMSQDPRTGESRSSAFSLLAYAGFRESTTTLTGVLAWGGAVLPPKVPGIDEGEYGQLVSGNYFTVLAVTPRLGRLLTEADDRPDAAPAAVISYNAWQTRFGGDRDVIGKPLAFESGTATIVGVAPSTFIGLGEANRPATFFVPLNASAVLLGHKGFAARMSLDWVWPVRVFGRLKPGATAADVQRELQPALDLAARAAWEARKPSVTPPGLPRLEVNSGSQGLTVARQRIARTLQILALIVGVVMVLVCVNVAGLVFARAEARRGEMALRLAIGAGRARVFRQLLTESAVLAGGGAALGVLLALWSQRLLVALVTRADPTFVVDPALDLRVLGATAVLTVVCALVIGIVPGISAGRLDLQRSLVDFRRPRRTRSVTSRAMVSAQVAISMVLVVVAGLLGRTLHNLQTADLGFRAERLLLFKAAFTPASPADFKVLAPEIFRTLHERLSAVPGVTGVAYSEFPLLDGSRAMPSLSVPGQPRRPGEDRTIYFQSIAPSFFETMEIPIQYGRAFEAADATRRVAIVNETLARRFFGGASALGQRIGITKDADAPDVPADLLVEIVGVVRDAKYMTPREDPMLMVFQPLAVPQAVTVAVRTSVDPSRLSAAIPEVVQSLGAPMAIADLRTQAQQTAKTFVREQQLAFLSSVFGVLALLLTSIGLYGLLTLRIVQQTRDIGVRRALGATRRSIVGGVLKEMLPLVIVGLVAGIAGASAVARALQAQLFGLDGHDPVTMAGAAAVLLAVALLASVLPARRALHVDPLVALRSE
jgi:predicted permease